jgi:hypothetical protein
MTEDQIRELIASWEAGIEALNESAEQEGEPTHRDQLLIRAASYQHCVDDLRDVLRGSGPGGSGASP